MGIKDAITLLGGLAFFLFGMSLLGEGLKRVAGSKLEVILAKLTSTTFRGVLLGTFVTAVIQSSSATTVMVVGFVNSGIMKLANAIGIIMGANIGTTATGWILVLAGVEGGGGFSSATMFALVAFVGIILYFFCKSQKKKNIGMIMLAFSVLMSGMQSTLFHPTDYVDISKVAKQKREACNCHKSQDMDAVYEWHESMERFRGMEFHCQRAEAFIHLRRTDSDLFG